ncbi:MAG: hypothetical protein K2K02_06945 [Ruminococcus sp.]|nr:hypothetical protein [Ruminococcus sp.]
MKKGYQCLYTILLLVTCLIASPLIFRQIWKSSKEIEPTSSKKPPVINIKNTGDKTTMTTTTNITDISTDYGMFQATTESFSEFSEEQTTAPAPVIPETAFVKSDPSYFDDALFIGDSRTVGICEYGTLPNADYFCSVGLSSDKIPNEYINGYSIYDMLSGGNYGKVYVMLGINEVGNDFDYIMTYYNQLIENIKSYQPNSIIYILANLHVTQERGLQGDGITNENINTLNAKMGAIADNEKIFYLDVNEIFDDASGNLMSECTNDGVHVLAKYYTTWCDWLCLNTVPVETPEEITEAVSETTTESYSYNSDGYSYTTDNYSNNYNYDYNYNYNYDSYY